MQQQVLKDTLGLGTFFWLAGYLASLVLFFTPFSNSMGWIMLVTLTPFTLWVTWWWFSRRGRLPFTGYAGIGIIWMLIAVVLDYLFIVLLFNAVGYYMPDVLVYYALMFLIPVGVGLYLRRAGTASPPG